MIRRISLKHSTAQPLNRSTASNLFRHRAVFLDRDGTLIHEAHYLSDPRKVKIYQGVPAALKRLGKAGFKLVIISNQSGIGRGWVSREAVRRVNRRMCRLLVVAGSPRFDGIYYCPHAPQDRCACRKPRPLLIKKAARDLRLNPRRSYVIGDKLCDMRLAKAVGARAVLVLSGHGRHEWPAIRRLKIPVAFRARRLSRAVAWILKDNG
ncbi:MAG: HAD family hydrolase [Elusimicrobiota bacterium]